jgi:hypothetical protein
MAVEPSEWEIDRQYSILRGFCLLFVGLRSVGDTAMDGIFPPGDDPLYLAGHL